MDIRLILSDIDHTLLPASQVVSRENIEAVRACRERGIEFVLATGRWYPAARIVANDQLGIEDGYIITSNGNAILRSDGSVLKEYGLTGEHARAVYDILRDEPVLMTSYVRGAIYRRGMYAGYLTGFRLPEAEGFFGDREFHIMDDDEQGFLTRGLDSPYKMEAYADDRQLLARLRVKLEEAGLVVSSSFPFNLEIVEPGTGKGAAARWLTQYLGLRKEQVMGFGDYTNDLAMLENVGWPVAVDNAVDEVKRICRIITDSCENSGVAKAIYKYVLGDEEP